jgi:hypothetical protein
MTCPTKIQYDNEMKIVLQRLVAIGQYNNHGDVMSKAVEGLLLQKF